MPMRGMTGLQHSPDNVCECAVFAHRLQTGRKNAVLLILL